jgi:hypothetical protein
LLEIFVGGAPEDEAAGDSPNGDRNTQLCGDAEDAVFHPRWEMVGQPSPIECRPPEPA